MHLEDLNWMDVEKYLEADDRLMLAVGACEQHGYLSLLTDVKIPVALATAASQRTKVLLAPPLNFGVSPYFAKYPGTISLRTTTFLAVLNDVVRGVYLQGFRRVLIVNGHGGNNAASGLLHELANDLPDLTLDWYSWWVAPSVLAVADKAGLTGDHANWLEAFPFCRVTELPTGQKPAVRPKRILNADETRRALGDGVYRGPYMADDAVMAHLFEAAVHDIVEKLKFERG